jgi:hypothetical protein
MRRSSRLCLLTILFAGFSPLASARTEQRTHLSPQFIKGGVLRYRVETRTSSNEHNVTPIVNPEGASQYKQSTSLVLRFQVLDVQPASQSSKGGVRFRATFEKAKSDSDANAYAPETNSLDEAIGKLEGQSFEFSIITGTKLADVEGLSGIAPNRDVAARVLSWVQVLLAPVTLPVRGVAIGQKWTNERQLDGMPLTGIVWRNESAYLRDEPCADSSGVESASPSIARGGCAVLLTRFSIFRHGSDHSDATPEAYIHEGLRTSGRWTGSGESLDAISLATGLLVSSTQTATQDMDYEIKSAISGSRIHHTGHTTTQTEITLLAAVSTKS